ncbi:MAG: DUF4347 domain-containing protein, partial [Planctomycetota bacterium]
MQNLKTIEQLWQRVIRCGGDASARGFRYLQRTRCILATHDKRFWETQRGRETFTPPQPSLSHLEPRILFSASPMPVDGDLPGAESQPVMEQVAFESSEMQSDATTASQQLGQIASVHPTEIAFVDARVPDAQALIEELLANAEASETDLRIVTLDPTADGIQTIADVLMETSDVSAVHIFTHGTNGAVQLGNVWLHEDNLSAHAGSIASWGLGLAENADILLYGCDVAFSQDGRDMIDGVAALTGADVAASDNTTGHTALDGDWDLEYATGAIETNLSIGDQFAEQWQHKLNTFVVDITGDVVGGAGMSLREAIDAANSASGHDRIELSAGTHLIELTGTGEDSNASGDFDILDDVTIVGAGVGETIIDGQGLDRVFDVQLGDATFQDLTITGGELPSASGGGIQASAALTLDRVRVTSNSAISGGGIFSDGAITLTDVTIDSNDSTSGGAGLFSQDAATLTNVTISGNTTTGSAGGGVLHSGGLLSLTNVTVSGNTSSNVGGGVHTSANTTINSSTITDNHSNMGAGIYNNSVSSITIANSIVAGNTTDANIFGGFASSSTNLFGDTNGATETSGFSGDLIIADARLTALGDHGGSTNTHLLLSTSNAIDAGTTTAATVDQRGISRVGTADLGATEYVAAKFSTTGEQRVNDSTAGSQTTNANNRGSQNAIAADALGNYVVVWTDAGSDGDGNGVYARRFDAAGVALTGDIQVANTTAGDQEYARVASDSAGNFVVTWQSESDVFARRFGNDGVALGNEFMVNTETSGNQTDPVIDLDVTTGEFIIAWHGNGPGDSEGVFFRRYSADGIAIDVTEKIANSDTSGAQFLPVVAYRAGGAFVVAWERSSKVDYRLFDADGNAEGGDQRLDGLFSNSSDLSVASNANGQFTFAYTEESTVRGIWIRGYNSDGSQNFSWKRIASGNDRIDASIAMDEQGNHLITWTNDEGDGTVEATVLDSDGNELVATFDVNTSSSGSQVDASGVILASGEYAVVWSGEGDQSGQADTQGVFVRQYGSYVPNAAPTDITLTNGTVDEFTDTSGGYNIGTLAAVDSDATGSASFQITGGTDSARFSLQGAYDEELLLDHGVLDFESQSSYEVEITATDDRGAIFAKTLVISVSNLTDTVITVTTTSIVDDAGASGDSIDSLLLNRGADGEISLIEALRATNGQLNVSGADEIRFDIGTGTQRISLSSALVVNEAVLIDGWSHQGHASGDRIIIEDSSGSNFVLSGSADGTTIRGLLIRQAGSHGIEIQAGSDQHTIADNWIGAFSTSGGPDLSERNSGSGIYSEGSSATIGGNDPSLRNVISGNTQHGLHFAGSASNNNIQGNYVGTQSDGQGGLGNLMDGILVTGNASAHQIGGSGTGEGNIIGFNVANGIRFAGTTSGSSVEGNHIGVAADGTTDIGNGAEGILASENASGITIGGFSSGQENVIAMNAFGGVTVTDSAAGISILGNQFFGHTDLDIDLGNDGLTPNDLNDADSGPNQTVNSAVLSDATESGGTVTVQVNFDGAASSGFRLDVYVTDAPNASGAGGAQSLVHSITNLAVDGSGDYSQLLTFNSVSVNVGDRLTALITDTSGNTSEFSVNTTVASPNLAPTIGGIEPSPLGYDENDPAVAVSDTVTVTDTENSIASATVQITGGYVTGEDFLALAAPLGLSQSFNATSGMLTISGIDTAANYQAALRTVTYRNNSNAPSSAQRTITFQVNDGTNSSGTASRLVTVSPSNDAPTSTPTIVGTATEDVTLTADASSIGDLDGLGAFSYQWIRGGVDITSATSSQYVLTDADVNETISVRVSYVDGGGTSENVVSASTAQVANVNDAPAGTVTIGGAFVEGSTLTADASGLSDDDGMGAISYQWLRGTMNIAGANASSYTLVAADVGQTIAVRVSYTDGQGTNEAVTSAPTAAVTNVNVSPTGTVTFSGTDTENSVLTGDASGINDNDGLGTFSYQWLR